MEEQLTNVAGARQIFERWMEWHPDEECWFAYINFEMRYQEMEKVRLGRGTSRDISDTRMSDT
jgi:crooked neck